MSGAPHSSIATEDRPSPAPAPAPGAARPAAGDDSPAPGTSGGAGGASGRAFWLPYGLIAAGVLGVCTVNAFSRLREVERLRLTLEPWQVFLFEYSSALLMLLLAPLVYLMLRRVPFDGRRWPVALLAHAAATVGFSAVHVAGMVALRKLVYALVGRSYVFELSLAELLYEYRKDLASYLAMLLGFWLIGRLLELERALAERRAVPAPEAGLLSLRDGNTTLRVKTADILWLAAAGNYVELALADGRKPLIRGTLQGFETTLAGHGFRRVHRSRLVNAARVVAIEGKDSSDFTLRLDDGSQLPGSRRYREGLKVLGR